VKLVVRINVGYTLRGSLGSCHYVAQNHISVILVIAE
jgi:hypothetical protein